MKHDAILKPGENCWRIEHADRATFLIDGDAYFKAFRAAALRAKRSIFLLGWDIDSRVPLLTEDPDDHFPLRLGEFLNAIVSQRRRLHAHILTWNFSIIYAAERELLPNYKLGWRTHRRLHFSLDDHHPVWASHHQKVAVIDDQVAFVGGFDISKRRWDTPEHLPQDPRRIDPDGVAYGPFHDVQMMVDGAAASALGELSRERWNRATGQRISAPRLLYAEDAWPPDVAPDIEDVSIAIARTNPDYDGVPEVREVERLYIDSIAAARCYIYAENQYFTSTRIGDALVASLQQTSGPEIVLNLPKQSSGWLEQSTMDALRYRVMKRIIAADLHHRLRMFYPDEPGLGDHCIGLHSKVFIVDDVLARVGSSNLSNRSMGLDTECDLALEANGDPRVSAAISRFRNTLLAEHLGTTVDKVDSALSAKGSLIAAIEYLQQSGRTLRALEATPPSSEIDELILDSNVIDPDGPIKTEWVAANLIPPEHRKPVGRRIATSLALLLFLLGLTAAWHWTPLRDWLDIEKLLVTVNVFKDNPIAPLVFILSYILGGLVALPVTVLIIVTLLTFDPVWGAIYAMTGALLSASLNFWIGYGLGRKTIRHFAGSYVNQLSHQLSKRGVLTMTAIRMLPVAPFSVVNVLAGASHIRFRDYIFGTFFGMMPGIIGLAILVERLGAAVQNPSPGTYAIFALVAGTFAVSALLLRRWLLKRDETPRSANNLG